MLEAFSNLLTFREAELLDDFNLLFADVMLLKPIGGVSAGHYDTIHFNFNKGEANAYNYQGDLIATGRFCVTPAT
jgi:hypothetical protein